MNNEVDVPKNFELADFETPCSNEVIRPMVWSVQKYEVAQMLALHGKSKSEVSMLTHVPISTINVWCKHPDFIEYTKSLIEQAAATMKNDNISLLKKIVAARVEQAEISGDYSKLSNKDTLDIIKELNVITEDDTKKEESNYTKLLERLVLGAMPKNKTLGDSSE